jgi:hypothetical protein
VLLALSSGLRFHGLTSEDTLLAGVQEIRESSPGERADKAVLQKYALQFNTRVMADPRVLEFFAERLGKNIRLLGKTLVFVPTIEAANRLTALLDERFPAYVGGWRLCIAKCINFGYGDKRTPRSMKC